MKNKKRKYIKYTKERVILSDVLPYEVPIVFSNKYFYRFLKNNNIELDGTKLKFDNNYKGDDKGAFIALLRLIFGFKAIQGNENKRYFDANPPWTYRKIPFFYKIDHKENNFRELTVIHPLNQLIITDFYNTYKELMLHYSSISNYSIRKPSNIAKYTFFNDKLHQDNKGKSDDFLELNGNEYENLKTFFSYQKFTNIYKFYEDYRFQRAEKKFKLLYKFDISKCFDSIYSHSIVWAVLGKNAVKENIEKSKTTFPGIFDQIIQDANYGETNGIVIGPEFSRIFAEIILQRIDRNVEKKLNEEGIYLKKHYELYRYVDDYFLFFDDEYVREKIINHFNIELKKYKLSINDLKSIEYSKPIITEISIAKQKIIQLLKTNPSFIIENVESDNSENDNILDNLELDKIKFRFDFEPNKFTTDFKIILKEANVSYKDILNFTLAILNNKIETQLKKFNRAYKKFFQKETTQNLTKSESIHKNKFETKFTSYITNFLDFVFFIYSVSPRVNSTIKVSNIISKIIKFYKGYYKIDTENDIVKISRFSIVNKDRVFKKISDEISLIVNKNTITRYKQVETLYLLVVLKELGKSYRLSEYVVSKYLNCINKDGDIEIKDNSLNYFSIVIALFYIGNSTKYNTFKTKLIDYIENYITSCPKEKRQKTSEMILLILDLTVCPFIDDTLKERLLLLFGIPEENIQKIIKFTEIQKYWFVKWQNFDLDKELMAKNSQEVYS